MNARGRRASTWAVLVAAVNAGRGTAWGTEFAWVGPAGPGSSGNWNTATNWSPTIVPSAGDTADVVSYSGGTGLPFTVNYDYPGQPVTLLALNVSADAGQPGTAAATLNMSSGTLSALTENVGGFRAPSATAVAGGGVVNQSGGTNTTGQLYVGAQNYATGVYSLSGTGTLNVTGGETIAYRGQGSLTQTGGTHTVGGTLNVGSGTLSLGNGLLSVGAEQIGTGAVTQSGGTHLIAGAGLDLELGTFNLSGGSVSTTASNGAFTANGTVGLTGGALNTSSMSIGGIANAGTAIPGAVTVTGGAATVAGKLGVGVEFVETVFGGTFVFPLQGSLTVAGTGRVAAGTVDVGLNNTLDLSGGSLVTSAIKVHTVAQLANDTFVTSVSDGSFSWSAGTLEITAATRWDPSGSPTQAALGSGIFISGSQALIVDGDEFLGGTGKFTLTVGSGATHTVAGQLAVMPGSKLTLQSGGTLNAGSINLNGSNTLFGWTGGTLNITSNVTFAPDASATATGSIFGAGLNLVGAKTLMVTGNEGITSRAGKSAMTLGVSTGSTPVPGTNVVTGTLTVGNNGTMNVSGGSLTAGATKVTGTGLLRYTAGTLNPGPVTVTTGGTVLMTTVGQAVVLGGLSIDSSSKFDLGHNDLIVHAGDLAAITAAAALGFNNGSWTGFGLTDATAHADGTRLTAVGVAPNVVGTTPIYTSFDGQPVSASDVLVRYAYYGDANLDGRVTAADYTRIDAGYVGHLTGWLNGDFNYDGVVDGSDYTMVDNAFNQQAGGIAAPAAQVAGAAAVPEPAALGLLTAGFFGGLACRRRRRW